MTEKETFVRCVLGDQILRKEPKSYVTAWMPANIALIKYWGKRCPLLNLPLVSSFSYTFSQTCGTHTQLELAHADRFMMNGKEIHPTEEVYQKIIDFLDLFRHPEHKFALSTRNTVPTSSGVASSASGFAALTQAILDCYGWSVSQKQRSFLSRIGSGSACRSFWPGLVFWKKGRRADGLDSYAFPLKESPSFSIAVVLLGDKQKKLSSRAAMEGSLSRVSMARKQQWLSRHARDLKNGLACLGDFKTFGLLVQEHSIFFHEWLQGVSSDFCYDVPASLDFKKKILRFQKEGLQMYFTQDAGSNVQLLFRTEEKSTVCSLLDQEGYSYLLVS